MSFESVMPSNHLIFCCPFLLLLSIFPSIRGFSNESALCIRWPKCWSFSNNPSNEYSRLISFGVDWFDILVVQGTLKSLLQHHSSNASILWCSAFCLKVKGWPGAGTGLENRTAFRIQQRHSTHPPVWEVGPTCSTMLISVQSKDPLLPILQRSNRLPATGVEVGSPQPPGQMRGPGILSPCPPHVGVPGCRSTQCC